ncbi:sulfite exporter TauE/SafE family protein [Thermopolyspora sp. NPDC052614]|uniref:urease accessory protein UreH domain-containing protein n=1 Tax=Thermopolyspora sp. NPDC052614 TaxID=3155682 RepID=UPI0034232542
MDSVALFFGGLAAGLVAGSGTCTLAQGGLLVALVRSPGCAPTRPSASGPRLVVAFAAGRFVSHVIAGALLGVLGGAVRLGPALRAVLLIAAGVIVVVLALRLLRGARSGHPAGCDEPTCPDATAGQGRAPGTTRALVVGAATVLVPCGVTLSIEVVAVSSGSAAGGALAMAGLVIGSTPAFAVLGLLLRRAAATRFAAVAAAAAIVAGLWTAASGLRLAGWLPDGASTAASAATVAVRPDGVQAVTIWATAEGYRPGVVVLRANTPTEIAFRVADGASCTRALTFEGTDTALPATVELPPRPPGRLRYVCGMGMYLGFIEFR